MKKSGFVKKFMVEKTFRLPFRGGAETAKNLGIKREIRFSALFRMRTKIGKIGVFFATNFEPF